MSENQIGFLYKAAAVVSKGNSYNTQNILKSYYLMRCKEITRGYGLPQKHFSVNSRCPQCCIEWRDNTETRVKPIKQSKKQRRRIRSRQNTKFLKDEISGENKLEKICGFCKHITTSSVLKPRKQNLIEADQKNNETEVIKKKITKKEQNIPKTATSVYCQSKEAFSLINKNNTLSSKIVTEKPKIVNCKKKKDKFAGLCQRAVLAANKLKHEKAKQNKINLFLKPS